uniref:Uncharacterized protein n=1 Tax=Fundulus heteroclitus TaxID=8078 RepID=A0A3Q2U3G4_FUNHE
MPSNPPNHSWFLPAHFSVMDRCAVTCQNYLHINNLACQVRLSHLIFEHLQLIQRYHEPLGSVNTPGFPPEKVETLAVVVMGGHKKCLWKQVGGCVPYCASS